MGSVNSSIFDYFAQKAEKLKNKSEPSKRREPYRSTDVTEQDSLPGFPNAIHDDLQNVDKINLYVKYDGGKQLSIDMFPLEKAQTLLENVCQQAMKDPKKMQLVYQGEPLDMKKTILECKLKRGHLIILARKS